MTCSRGRWSAGRRGRRCKSPSPRWVYHLQQAVVAVVSPLRHVGGDGLVGHYERAARLGHLARLAVEVFNGARAVLAEHQPADAVLRGVAPAVVVPNVVLRVVGIVDARQAVVVIVVGDGFAFPCEVGRLLACHVAKRVVGERGLAAGRMNHLRAAVAHVIR